MTPNQSANVWLGRFSSHLLRLRPDLELHIAVQRGVIVYTRQDELDPEEAAYLSSRTLPRRPKDRVGSRASAAA